MSQDAFNVNKFIEKPLQNWNWSAKNRRRRDLICSEPVSIYNRERSRKTTRIVNAFEVIVFIKLFLVICYLYYF